MKKIPVIAIIAAFALLFSISTFHAEAQSKGKVADKQAERTLKPKHQSLECFDCHLEKNPTSSLKVTCSNCHGTPEDVAKLTEKKYKEHYNPHNALHYGTNALCENCHREHTVSKLECNNPLCHSEFKYVTP